MTCPLLPLSPPLASLEQSSSTTHSRARAWNNLTTIMHVGLSHFSGRNLPNVMEIVLGIRTGNLVARDPSEADMRMIMGWAGELDAWLLRYRRPTSKFRHPGLALRLSLQESKNAVSMSRTLPCFSISYTSYSFCRSTARSPGVRCSGVGHRISITSC